MILKISWREKFLRIFVNIFWLVCRTVTNFLLTQRAMLRGPSRYLEHVRKVHRKFCRGLWKKSFSSKHKVLSEYSNLIFRFISFALIFWALVNFLLVRLFESLLEIFPWTLRICSKYNYERSAWPESLCHQKKKL